MGSQYQLDQCFMKQALVCADMAYANDEVPVGAIIVKGDVVIGKGFNRVIQQCDPSAHAEVVAIQDAARTVNNHRLSDCTMYVTLEPCVMCAGAILQARIARVIFAAWDKRFGAAGSQLNLLDSPFLNHRCEVHSGVLRGDAARLLKRFFESKR